MKKEKRTDLENNILQNKEILNELQQGSDRSKVILGASIVEVFIERLLRKKLVSNNKAQKEAFDYNGFLGTFSSKIQACYLLGLISKKIYNDINRIRIIRNYFAHNLLNCSFSDKDVIEEVNKLVLLKDAFKSEWDKQSVAMMFLMEVSLIYVALTKKIVRVPNIEELPYEINDLGFEDIDFEYLGTLTKTQN